MTGDHPGRAPDDQFVKRLQRKIRDMKINRQTIALEISRLEAKDEDIREQVTSLGAELVKYLGKPESEPAAQEPESPTEQKPSSRRKVKSSSKATAGKKSSSRSRSSSSKKKGTAKK